MAEEATNRRLRKQLVIGAVFIVILFFIGYGIYEWLEIDPTCYDNIQNGLEEGVDCGQLACGRTCAPAIFPIDIKETRLVPAGSEYDFLAQVYNPNSSYGASVVQFDVVIKLTDGEELQRRSGNFSILPGQTKFLVVPLFKNIPTDAQASLNIKSVEWQEFTDSGVSFVVKGERILPPDSANPNGYSLEATALNNSDYDFDRVEVVAILFDSLGEIIGANVTNINTHLSRTERYFKVTWPFLFATPPSRAVIEVNTNIFENSNYIRSHGTPERFQQYY